MGTQQQEAGPGSDRKCSLPVVPEAAGPAGPRLVIEEVRVRVGPDSVEAATTLAASGEQFVGTVRGQGQTRERWKLAAAASVGAIQQYMHQCRTVPPTLQIQLVDAVLTTTSIGQEAIHATVRLTHGSQQTNLLGSALVRNDRCSTAAAAALDATSRRLGAFCLPAPPSLPGQQVPEPGEPSCLTDQGCAASKAAVSVPRDAAPLAAPSLALGVQIGGTSIQAAIVDSAGRIVMEVPRTARVSANPEEILSLSMETCREALAAAGPCAQMLGAVGLIVPGTASSDDATLEHSGESASWRDVQLADSLADELGVPVTLLSEAEATALAEARFGAAKGIDNLIFVRIGTHIDIAAVREATPLHLKQAGHMVVDASGPRCGCGQQGCWQALAGYDALVGRAIREIANGAHSPLATALTRGPGAITPALICRAAMGGDAVASGAVHETGRCLAMGLGNLIAIFNPEAAMIAGHPQPVGAALRRAAETELKSGPRSHAYSHCVLLSPELGDRGPLIGAATWAATVSDGKGERELRASGAG